jgi:hypothetical protein
MEDYGVFTNIVASAGTIIAMGAAIGLAWRGRAKWEPSEDDVPKAPQKVAGLLSAVAITVIWASLQESEYMSVLSKLSLGLTFAALVCLCLYAFLVATQTYEQVITKSPKRFDKRNIIGGFKLTENSLHIINEYRTQGKPPPTTSDLFKAAAYDPDKVWTRPSRALAKILCILSYVGLIATGTVALASAAILVDVKMKASKVAETQNSNRTLGPNKRAALDPGLVAVLSEPERPRSGRGQ